MGIGWLILSLLLIPNLICSKKDFHVALNPSKVGRALFRVAQPEAHNIFISFYFARDSTQMHLSNSATHQALLRPLLTTLQRVLLK